MESAAALLRWAVAICLALAVSSCSQGASTTATESSPTSPLTSPSGTANRTATATATPILYEQVADPNQVDARTSQIAAASGFPPTIVYDDFTVDQGGTVAGLTWQGIYCVEQEGAPSSPPTASGFVINIYPDLNGEPARSDSLLHVSFDLTEVSQTIVASRAGFTCGSVTSSWDFYTYDAALPDAFTAEAGVRYWLSVQAVTPTYATFWAWLGSSQGDLGSLQEYNGTVTPFNLDRVFTLSG